MKKNLIIILCVCCIGLAACGEQSDKVSVDTGILDKTDIPVEPTETKEPIENTEQNVTKELTDEELLELFYEQFYGGRLTSEKMEELSFDAAGYQESAYYDEITYYWEVIRGVTDISNFFDPLYFTDMKYYTEEDFEDATPVAIHLAKNEIYAKHGYIFKDEDLNKYFRGCAWYRPLCTAEEFDDSVFNDYERKNLELLAKLDAENVSKLDKVELEQHYYNSQGQEGYYYYVDSFYFSDAAESGKYDLVNQTLQRIYAEQENQYQAFCMERIDDYEVDESIENESQSINYVAWFLVDIPYIGDDYVSILFNDIEYDAGAAHPLSYFSPVTISMKTGEIVTAKDVLNMSWDEIWSHIKTETEITYESEEEFNKEYGFYLTNHTLTYLYRTNFYVEPIVIVR